MGDRLVIVVPGRISGKQRAGRRRLRGGKILSFNPAKTKAEEDRVQYYAIQALKQQNFARLLFGPISVAIYITQTAPESWSKRRQADTYWITGKPDVDNVIKLVLDALKVIWSDDSQVAQVYLQRTYGLHNGVEIVVRQLMHAQITQEPHDEEPEEKIRADQHQPA